MAKVTMLHKASKMQSADRALVDKAAWALRQRLRKQMNQLSHSFFDEVDDFVFEAGKLGQLAEGCDYLSAMREIRAKQVLFEESFLDTAYKKLERARPGASSVDVQSLSASDSPVIFESMELELAIGTMSRKANKFYLPYMKQIDSLNAILKTNTQNQLISGSTLIASVILAFAEAQGLVNLSLEIRLVFMKLFEQHFLMKLEKLFLDIISILNNIDNRQFVERLHSSSSSFHAPVANSCTPKEVTQNKAPQNKVITDFQPIKPDSRAVESSVSEALQIVHQDKNVPEFVSQMADEHWRMVLLLIGLNKGVSSLEWQEAEHVLQLLALCSAGQIEVEQFDRSLLVEKLSQGLRLLRLPSAIEERFIVALKKHLAALSEPSDSSKTTINKGCVVSIQPEATVSPSGANILDAADLDEIAQLIGGEPSSDATVESDEQVQLLECLATVDGLSDCCSVRMFIKGNPYKCMVTRSGPEGNIYIITNADTDSTSRKIAITRSRLGLAISIRRAEIVLTEDTVKPSASNITVFERKPK